MRLKESFLLILLLVLFAFSYGFSGNCTSCGSGHDCSNDCVFEDNDDYYCKFHGIYWYGCYEIKNDTAFITCNSDNLEKQSDDAGFGSNGFVYDSSHPYYCTDYNQTGNYTWKTCYDGAPDANWYSVQLACSNGELYECTDKSGISGTAKGDCGSITVNSQKLYCDGKKVTLWS